MRALSLAPSLLAAALLPAACGDLPPASAPPPVEQAEVRHCAEGAPPLAALGLSARVVRRTRDGALVEVTNERDAPITQLGLSAHFGFAPCGREPVKCDVHRALRGATLAPGQRVEIFVDGRVATPPFPCTSMVLALTARRAGTSDDGCSDLAAWTVVQGRDAPAASTGE